MFIRENKASVTLSATQGKNGSREVQQDDPIFDRPIGDFYVTYQYNGRGRLTKKVRENLTAWGILTLRDLVSAVKNSGTAAGLDLQCQHQRVVGILTGLAKLTTLNDKVLFENLMVPIPVPAGLTNDQKNYIRGHFNTVSNEDILKAVQAGHKKAMIDAKTKLQQNIERQTKALKELEAKL